MPINKVVGSFDEAVKDVFDGAVILLGGFGGPGGVPCYLIKALAKQGAKELTLVGNVVSMGKQFLKEMGRVFPDWFEGPGLLYENGQVRKGISAFPVSPSSRIVNTFGEVLRAGEEEVELVPQGTLAGRIRANKAGIGAFFTPTSPGTLIGKGKEVRVIDGRPYVLEYPIKADFAFVRAYKADRLGNLIYRGTSRTFNATMAGAAKVTIAEVDEVIPVEEMDPEAVVTPTIWVERVVVRPQEGRTKIVQKIRMEER